MDKTIVDTNDFSLINKFMAKLPLKDNVNEVFLRITLP